MKFHPTQVQRGRIHCSIHWEWAWTFSSRLPKKVIKYRTAKLSKWLVAAWALQCIAAWLALLLFPTMYDIWSVCFQHSRIRSQLLPEEYDQWKKIKNFDSGKLSLAEWKMDLDCRCTVFPMEIPSRELTYPPDKAYLKMIFLFPRWDMLISWRYIPFLCYFYWRTSHRSSVTDGAIARRWHSQPFS